MRAFHALSKWEERMKLSLIRESVSPNASPQRMLRAGGLSVAAVAVAVALAACGGDDSTPEPTLAVAKASCGSSDRPESGLQGQIPIAERTTGFQGFNCNLQKTAAVDASRGTGPWQPFVSVRVRAA